MSGTLPEEEAMSEKRPVLSQLNLVPRDFDASLAFYRRLGVEVEDASAPAQGHRHVEAEMPGGFTLELDNEGLAGTYNAGWRRDGGSSRALIGFSVSTREKVDELYADLTAAGHEGRQPPYDAFWGSRYAIVADPDGNDVGIMSPVDERLRTWPPQESPAS